jgi:glycosyltransferase involved in cell wall biosynthesis
MKIYFYPSKYFRDRHFDTMKGWPQHEVLNPMLAENRRGIQVSSSYANDAILKTSWKRKLPLINLKLRPTELPSDAVIYTWGAIVATGRFIVDLDNPWSLVAYNLRAMPIYRLFIKHTLLSGRCLEIRCMSEACRVSLKLLFGDKVYDKSQCHYPCISQSVTKIDLQPSGGCKFLFVGTQFEIKGGVSLIKAFRRVYDLDKSSRLDVITHLPSEFKSLVEGCDGIHVHQAEFTRKEIHDKFMKYADVLVLPTFVESFGMVALEALSHGLALIATDVYALRELLRDGKNGILLNPPISVWDGVLPSSYYFDLKNIKKHIRQTDTSDFEKELVAALEKFSTDPNWLREARKNSISLFNQTFLC